MGVPHLIANLQPHAETILLTKSEVRTGSDTSNTFTKLVIDGPGLAYHIYYKCLSLRANARNALEAYPSYQELGHAVVAWLNHLDAYGLQIEAIFFDGLLPKSKRGTRLARLDSYLNQLSSFRSLYNTGLPIAAARTPLEAVTGAELFAAATVPVRRKALPAPPFLVPAIIEALLSSRFESITSVIPGEADAFCAEHARTNGCTVITSDSDLLVHYLGPNSSVIFFKDLESGSSISEDALKAVYYCPARIAADLKLPSLVKLAFEMKRDYTRGFRDAVQRAKTSDDVAFGDFHAEHTSIVEHSMLCKTLRAHGSTALSGLLSRLDPRISEFVHQHGALLSSAPRVEHHVSGMPRYRMYLPFLIDDPTRASAWRCAAPVRRLAYSILNLQHSERRIIEEYERRGTRIASTDMSSSTAQEVAQSCQSLVGTIAEWMQKLDHLNAVEKWRVFALVLCCHSLIAESRIIPTRTEVKQVLTAQRTNWTWAEIHIRAQVDAVLYSLRILKQILDLYMVIPAECRHHLGVPDLGEVQRRLSAFPQMATLHVHLAEPLASLAFQNETIAVVLEVLEIQEEAEAEASENKPGVFVEVQGRKKRRRKGRLGNGEIRQPESSKSDNIFALLEVD